MEEENKILYLVSKEKLNGPQDFLYFGYCLKAAKKAFKDIKLLGSSIKIGDLGYIENVDKIKLYELKEIIVE